MRRPAVHKLWIALAVQAALVLQAAALLPIGDLFTSFFGAVLSEEDEIALEDSGEVPAPAPQIAEEELEAVLPSVPSLLVGSMSSEDHFHLHLAPRDGHQPSLDRPPRA